MLNLCKKRESWDRRQRDSCTTAGDMQAQSGLRREGRRHRRLRGGRDTDCGDDGRWERWWCYNYVHVTLSQQTDTQWHAMSQCWQPHTMVDQMLSKCPEKERQRAGGLLVVSCSVQSCLQSSQISCARPGRQWTVSSSRAAVPSTSHVPLLPSWQHLDTRHPPLGLPLASVGVTHSEHEAEAGPGPHPVSQLTVLSSVGYIDYFPPPGGPGARHDPPKYCQQICILHHNEAAPNGRLNIENILAMN